MEDKRHAEKEEMLKTAAEVWDEWKYSHGNPNQREWVARQVKRRCRVEIQGKRVSRNLEEIQKRVEALKNANS